MRQAQADESVQNSALGQLAPNREQACGITKHLRNSSTTARFPCLQMHYSRYEALNLSVASPCSSEAAAAWLRIELDAIFCRRTRSPGMTYGYSLAKGFDINEERLRQGERISVTAGALSRLMADAYALMVRLTARCKGYVQRQLRPQLSAHLPGPLKVRIQRLLQKNVSHQKAAGHGFVLEEHKQPPSYHNSPQC